MLVVERQEHLAGHTSGVGKVAYVKYDHCYFEMISVDGRKYWAPWAKMSIRVDLDGTLTKASEVYNHESYENAEPNLAAIEFVKKCRELGMFVIIHTARFEVDRKVTEKWLKDHGVVYNHLELDKPRCVIEVDDLHPDYSGNFELYEERVKDHVEDMQLMLKEK